MPIALFVDLYRNVTSAPRGVASAPPYIISSRLPVAPAGGQPGSGRLKAPVYVVGPWPLDSFLTYSPLLS